jgi:hypothetical protein
MRSETRDLLAWLDEARRTYPEAIDVWRTTCPQHSVWEDAIAARLVEIVRSGTQAHVVLTPRGRAALAGG